MTNASGRSRTRSQAVADHGRGADARLAAGERRPRRRDHTERLHRKIRRHHGKWSRAKFSGAGPLRAGQSPWTAPPAPPAPPKSREIANLILRHPDTLGARSPRRPPVLPKLSLADGRVMLTGEHADQRPRGGVSRRHLRLPCGSRRAGGVPRPGGGSRHSRWPLPVWVRQARRADGRVTAREVLTPTQSRPAAASKEAIPSKRLAGPEPGGGLWLRGSGPGQGQFLLDLVRGRHS